MREAVIDAAIGIFASKGFEGATLGEIARLSAVKQPLIVYHFKNKETLWEVAAGAIMQRFDALHQQYYEKETTEGENERTLLRALIRSFIHALRDLPEYGRMLMLEGGSNSTRVAWIDLYFVPRLYREVVFNTTPLLRTYASTSLLRHAVAGAALYIVVAGPQLQASALGLGMQQADAAGLYPLDPTRVDELADMLCDFIMHQLDKSA